MGSTRRGGSAFYFFDSSFTLLIIPQAEYELPCYLHLIMATERSIMGFFFSRIILIVY